MTKGIVVLGAGGHAKVVIELLQASGYQVDYCISKDKNIDFCLQIPVLKDENSLNDLWNQGYRQAFVAIGDNKIRQKQAEYVRQRGFELVNAISPYAIVSSTVKLGTGIAIMAGAVINSSTYINDLVVLNTGAVVDHDCHIAPGVHIAPQCGLAGNVSVGENSFLGIGCKVIPEIQIGRESVIGAGSVVINDIPDQVTAVGIPARIIQQGIVNL